MTRLAVHLAREQRAFLVRSQRGWTEHLQRVRGFLGAGLRAGAGPGPCLVLGAGSGLEVPWARAAAGTVGWDADPWSRVWTCLRHRRWPPWVFADLTGGLEALAETALRATRETWSGRLRRTGPAAARLAGLLATLDPQAAPLRAWVQEHRPGTIVAANVMGQFGVVAQGIVERAFGSRSPWSPDPEALDPLEEAVNAWTLRALRAFLAVLAESGADLWLCHDRGVIFSAAPVTLGPLADPWTAQLQAPSPLEVADPLLGLDPRQAFPGRDLEQHQRWLWPLGPGQVQVIEAFRVLPAAVPTVGETS